VWDFGGAWPAYLVGTAWGAVLTLALLRAPEAEFFDPRAEHSMGRPRFRARDAWPRVSDYADSITLIAIPAIAVSMAIMSMRNTTYSIQTSIYVVHLDQVGLVGTTIGILFAAAEIASGCGALFAGRAMRLGNPQRTMLSGTVLSILLISMTPLLGGVFTLLLAFQLARGWLEGVIQPLVLSVQAKAVGRHQQGAVVGLRQTGQRLTSILVPPLIGGIADRWGVGESFVICCCCRSRSPCSPAASCTPARKWRGDRVKGEVFDTMTLASCEMLEGGRGLAALAATRTARKGGPP